MQYIDDYRPISILSSLSKTFEKLIKVQPCEYIDRNDIISNNQFGFSVLCWEYKYLKRLVMLTCTYT